MKLDSISAEAREWWTPVAVPFGLFMIMVDDAVVNVAPPAIGAEAAA